MNTVSTTENQLRPRLRVAGLACARNDRLLFSDLSFELTPGSLLLVEGENGSGKTSLLRILCGFRQADSGSVSWDDLPFAEASREYLRNLCYVGHKNGHKDELTVAENLRVSRSLGLASQLSDQQILQRIGLQAYEDHITRQLSAGQQRRLALARLLATDSTLWILDEPFTAMDRGSVKLFEQVISEHVEKSGMVIMTAHHDLNFGAINVMHLHLSAR